MENLDRLVIEEKQSEREMPPSFSLKKERKISGIFEGFTTTARFKKIYDEARRSYPSSGTKEEINQFMKDFSGRLYQDIAYYLLAKNLPASTVLLSPERTSQFFGKLFPGKKVVSFPFGLTSFEDVSIPDGIMTKETIGKRRIISLCEYTLSKSPRVIEKKRRSFSKHKRDFPLLFAPTKILFIVPKEGSYFLKLKKEEGLETPFGYEEFWRFIHKFRSFR